MLDPLLCKTIHQICLPLKYLTVQHWRLFLQLIPILCRPDQSLEFIYQLNPTLLLAHNEPKSVKQALADSKRFNAMKQEHEALMNNKTWDLVSLPPNRKAVG